MQITSGLGAAAACEASSVLPVLFEGQVKAVMELSSFEQFSPMHQAFLDQLVESIGIVLNTIEANTLYGRLAQAVDRSLAKELQSRQEELQNTKNRTAGQGAIAGRAERGSGTQEQRSRAGPPSTRRKAPAACAHFEIQIRVPCEHAHELRTPLNSILILADQLAQNIEGNLVPKQVEFAQRFMVQGRTCYV